MVVASENSLLLTRFNTCPLYFKVESKITRDFAAQCSLFTYSQYYYLRAHLVVCMYGYSSILYLNIAIMFFQRHWAYLDNGQINV